MNDPVVQSMEDGFLVIWEEIARDGAQAKTLLSGEKRVEIARRIAALFGPFGPDHLVFAAGYPSMGREEFEAVRRMGVEVDHCSLATHGRMLRADIDIGLAAMAGAAHGRVSFAVPVSEKHSRAMLHQSTRETMRQGREMARYALDRSDGIPIDIAFGGASDVDPAFLRDEALALFEEGVATIKFCDSAGKLYPRIAEKVLGVIADIEPRARRRIGVHLHNDLGFALTNNIEAIRLGLRMVATSWLGLAERIGLAPTEQLLFVLAFQEERLMENTDIAPPLWKSPPDLRSLYRISQHVSEIFGIPLRSTDPIVSPHIGDIGTGAYFNDPDAFKPFDSEKVMGVPRQLVLTHLANKKIVRAIALELGFDLKPGELGRALDWVKRFAYENSVSEIPRDQFIRYLKEGPTSHGPDAH